MTAVAIIFLVLAGLCLLLGVGMINGGKNANGYMALYMMLSGATVLMAAITSIVRLAN
jgi:hypothetical protein